MVEEALKHLVCGITDFPDDVKIVSEKSSDKCEVLRIHANHEDLGRIIGKSGRTIRALRKVINALADGNQIRVELADNS